MKYQLSAVMAVIFTACSANIPLLDPSARAQYSHFWELKLKTVYTHTDLNHDGLLTLEEYNTMAHCMSDAGNLNEEDAEGLENAFEQLFKNFYQAEGLPCTYSQGLQYREQQPMSVQLAMIQDMSSRFFVIMDSDMDDVLDETEFSVFGKCFGGSNDTEEFAFQHLDTDHDGVISKTQFFTVGINFYQKQTGDGSSQFLWGPLMNETEPSLPLIQLLNLDLL